MEGNGSAMTGWRGRIIGRWERGSKVRVKGERRYVDTILRLPNAYLQDAANARVELCYTFDIHVASSSSSRVEFEEQHPTSAPPLQSSPPSCPSP